MDRIFYDNQEYAKYSDKFLKRFNLADQAAYDALPAATKNDDSKVFFIPDIPEHDYLYKWDFTNSLVDKVQGSAVTLGANAVRTSSGVSFTGKGDRIIFDRTVTENILSDKVIEIDVAEMNFQGNTNYDMNFLVIPSPTSNATGILEFMKGLGWGIWYNGEAFIISSSLDRNLFNNGTIKIISKNTQTAQHYDISLYFNNQLLGQLSDTVFRISARERDLMTLGSSNVSSPSNGDQCYNMTITGVRIYENEEEGN